jgi:hypothetical protein
MNNTSIMDNLDKYYYNNLSATVLCKSQWDNFSKNLVEPFQSRERKRRIMQIGKALIILWIVVISLSACASQNEGFPSGEYTGVSGRLISFFPDGSYTFMSTGGDLIVKNAPYSLDGNTLKLDDGFDNLCMGFEGEYEWSHGSNGIIDLKLISEKCGSREAPLIGSLTPVR